jgi:phosphate transport system substrate-binding protein
MKKLIVILTLILSATGVFAQTGKDITVVSRESGSGTRGAFIEITGVEVKTDTGKKDMTTPDAIIANRTDVMMASVAGNPNAIGYISLGSLNSNVKAVQVNAVDATVANIRSGAYKLARPFILATSPKANAAAQDFIDFMLSAEGQKVVANGYITLDNPKAGYASKKPSGRITVAGSSSVTPVMEQLVEAYAKLNPNLKIEIQMSDSSTGMLAAMNNTCDIGMASRALNTKELAVLKPIEIAIDGIAIVVNNASQVKSLSDNDIREIFTGKRAKW